MCCLSLSAEIWGLREALWVSDEGHSVRDIYGQKIHLLEQKKDTVKGSGGDRERERD